MIILKLKIMLFKLLMLLSIKAYSFEQSVDVEAVIKSTFKHHPLILSQINELSKAKGFMKEQKGLFDMNLNLNAKSYLDGYYDGKAFSVFLDKPMYYLNSKVYAGYRNSDGSFPIYDQDLLTLDKGEVFAGVAFSLLKGRAIDEKRYKYLLSIQDAVQSELSLKGKYIELQTIASKAYFTWLKNLEKYRINMDLLSLAEERTLIFNKRIKKGDLARIYASENEQYILKRKYKVNKALTNLFESSLYLSLFFRDNDGNPIILTPKNKTKLSNLEQYSFKSESSLVNIANANSLEIKTLESKLLQLSSAQKIGQNDLLPTLDIKYEVSDDRGYGDSNLSPSQQSLYLNVGIPIERRLGRGKVAYAKSGQDSLKLKIRYLKENNKVKVMTLINNLKTYKENYGFSNKEIELAKKLRQAEVTKFNKGASDFILVNLREENLTQSRLKNLIAYVDYHLTYFELRKIAVDYVVAPIAENVN